MPPLKAADGGPTAVAAISQDKMALMALATLCWVHGGSLAERVRGSLPKATMMSIKALATATIEARKAVEAVSSSASTGSGQWWHPQDVYEAFIGNLHNLTDKKKQREAARAASQGGGGAAGGIVGSRFGGSGVGFGGIGGGGFGGAAGAGLSSTRPPVRPAVDPVELEK